MGGCVRDYYLQIPCKDYDIEIYAISDLHVLEDILSKYGKLVFAGKSFGVLKLSCDCYDFDFALPRTEKKISKGHQGFEIISNGHLEFKQAAIRRDFTVNALGYDYETKEMLDPFNGKKDLENKILKHIDDKTFVEDPLRVYRAIQFCARFELTLDKQTFLLCEDMVLKNQLEELAKERIFEELKKLLLKAKQPSLGFELLKNLGILKYYHQLEALVGCLQDEEYHPEGDVWVHTLMCLDEMAKLKSEDEYKNLYLMLAVLCHDFGKPHTSKIIKGRITSHNHEKEGVAPTVEFLSSLCNEKKLIEKVVPLVQYHLAPFQLYLQNSSLKAIKRLAAKVNIEELCTVALADCKGRTIPNKDKCDKAVIWLLSNAKELNVHNQKLEALVQGRDLISLGLSPGPKFSEILEFAYELQIENNILEQNEILFYIKQKYITSI